MQNFLNLFDSICNKVLVRWIPGLEYKICNSDAEIQALYQKPNNIPNSYNDKLRCQHHCLKLNELWFDFHRDREILGVERAFIEWSLEKALEYAPRASDEFLERAILDKLSKLMIATYLLFDAFDLNNPWKQFSGKLEYFGCTESHYDLTRRELFNVTEICSINYLIEIMDSVEKFSVSTNEGAHFPFSLMVDINTEEESNTLWKEFVERPYAKSLAQAAVPFIVNGKGQVIDYKIPSITFSK